MCIGHIECQASIFSTNIFDSGIEIGIIKILDPRDTSVGDKALLCSTSKEDRPMITLKFNQDPQIHLRKGTLFALFIAVLMT